MALDLEGDWLAPVRRVPSPNYDQRPPGTAIELLVLHAISLPPGEYGGGHVDLLFSNSLDPEAHPYFRELRGLKVSSHVLIERDGRVTQYVPFSGRAWHAGASCYRGRSACNDFSIGIELEGCDQDPFTDTQYRVLAAVALLLRRRWPAITPERVVGHCDIAPGRKTDPGPLFDWARLHQDIA